MDAAITTQQPAPIPTTLRTGQAAALMGIRPETLCRWSVAQDDRGLRLRKARLSRGRYSTSLLREARLI